MYALTYKVYTNNYFFAKYICWCKWDMYLEKCNAQIQTQIMHGIEFSIAKAWYLCKTLIIKRCCRNPYYIITQKNVFILMNLIDTTKKYCASTLNLPNFWKPCPFFWIILDTCVRSNSSGKRDCLTRCLKLICPAFRK